jgi:glycosyltransferase involved in cell wall biosynthesis
MRPRFSVIVPLFNNAAVVARSIRSILRQDYGDLEIVVVDDGSTDSGAEVVGGFEDPRVRLIVQANQGPSAARNRGVVEALGDWIGFLDADDEWMPTMLAAVNRLIEEDQLVELCYTRHVRDSTLNGACSAFPRPAFMVTSNYFQSALAGKGMWTGAVFVKAEFLKADQLFDLRLRKAQDSDLWDRLAMRSQRTVHIPEVHAIYHTADSNSVKRHLKRTGTSVAWGYYCRRDEYLARNRVPARLRKSYIRYMDSSVLSHVQQRALEGAQREALVSLFQYYKWSWLPRRCAAALLAIVVGPRMWARFRCVVPRRLSTREPRSK